MNTSPQSYLEYIWLFQLMKKLRTERVHELKEVVCHSVQVPNWDGTTEKDLSIVQFQYQIPGTFDILGIYNQKTIFIIKPWRICEPSNLERVSHSHDDFSKHVLYDEIPSVQQDEDLLKKEAIS